MASACALIKSLAMVIFLLAALLSLSVGLTAGETYIVGDDAGWFMPAGKLNYNEWSATKTFQLGDTLVFVYDNEKHNVLEVCDEDYGSCNSQSPIMAYGSGNDSISIKKPGRHYFICGVSGHCEAGQKFSIAIGNPGNASSPPSSSPSPPAPSNSSDDAGSKNQASAAYMGLALTLATCTVAAVFSLILPH